MDCNIQLFQNEQFGNVRVQLVNDEPLFCLADVCKILELTSTKVVTRLDKDVLSKHTLLTAGGIQQASFVNEDGLYDVILDSRKPEAKQFRKWVTSEVLPTIRKHGIYATPATLDEMINNPDLVIRMAQEIKKAREEKQKAIQECNAAQQKAILLEEDNQYKQGKTRSGIRTTITGKGQIYFVNIFLSNEKTIA